MNDGKVGLIFKQMSLVLADIDAIAKNRQNTENYGPKFKYRGIDDLYNELHNVFAKHKVFCTSNVLDRSVTERQSKNGGNLFYTTCKIAFRFYAEDGSFVESVTVGEAMDSGDKSTNKAMAVAHKYALIQAFLIPTEEDKDTDAKTHEVSPKNIDSSKWAPSAKKTEEEEKKKQDTAHLTPSMAQLKVLFAIKKNKDWSDENIKQFIYIMYGIDSTKKLNLVQYNDLVAIMKAYTFDEASQKVISK